MDRTSFFIKDKALFGSFPTQDAVNELEEKGVRYFVNLTHDYERKIEPYKTKYKYIHFPIVDHRVPRNWKTFARFIIYISDIIKSLQKTELLYIHCKGGHGRSGIVVSCIYCYLFNLDVATSLKYTNLAHSKRPEMREKWRLLGSPQTQQQKNFVYMFFKELYFNKPYKSGNTIGFSNFSHHNVNIDGFGNFPTSEAAIQAYKNPDDKYYVSKQINACTPVLSKILGNNTNIRSDWDDICEDITFKVLLNKFNQHTELRENLMETGMKRIVFATRGDSFWGEYNGVGQNKLGKVLMKLREYYYRSRIS